MTHRTAAALNDWGWPASGGSQIEHGELRGHECVHEDYAGQRRRGRRKQARARSMERVRGGGMRQRRGVSRMSLYTLSGACAGRRWRQVSKTSPCTLTGACTGQWNTAVQAVAERARGGGAGGSGGAQGGGRRQQRRWMAWEHAQVGGRRQRRRALRTSPRTLKRAGSRTAGVACMQRAQAACRRRGECADGAGYANGTGCVPTAQGVYRWPGGVQMVRVACRRRQGGVNFRKIHIGSKSFFSTC
ncbi:hypothetical protein GGX14DRAFT_600483 [Mycena pura]|uniref:Uncharacterized protein n=1 Tax=Mycena pura TaxID=153505 RepID=A0AAD6UQG4_9AGAR|nr:hypothetical protein GGX14DRAFT_600483 [Mycena pura]